MISQLVNTFFLTFGFSPLNNHRRAGVVKLVDAGDSKSPVRKGISVRFRAPAPYFTNIEKRLGIDSLTSFLFDICDCA